MESDMTSAIRIFKVGSRVELRGLELKGCGTVTKIGRTRATIKLDAPPSTTDAIGRKKRPAADYAHEYKHLRLLAG